jgi:hypothetical protein
MDQGQGQEGHQGRKRVPLEVGNLNGKRSYRAWPSYLLSKLANVIFTQEVKHCAFDARLKWHTATWLLPGVVDTNLWRYVIGEERLAKIKDGRGLGLLALGAMRLFAKTPEGGAFMQGYVAPTSNSVIKGAFYKEMKEKGDFLWFTKDDTKARAL